MSAHTQELKVLVYALPGCEAADYLRKVSVCEGQNWGGGLP